MSEKNITDESIAEDGITEEKSGGEMPQDVPLPKPDLLMLVSRLATQAMVSMGIFPNPATGKSTFLLYQAQHLIETVAMLDEKTKGSQTTEETEKIQNVLHELRMLFVASQKEKERRTEN
ncbi:hypothetical protein FACS18942_01520 [Planctomycetales bacterium]|nr:hypothetical protein FACS18942_01520 [Planctomycetales bacterium]GHT38906.1 hypothetical protein FACS189427_13180 [Planctomycetales bacterium]